jgi:hypothetical protein
LEGRKRISWKKDQETDGACNFTFSFAKLLGQSSCSEEIIKANTTNKPPVGTTVTGSAANCAAQNGACSSTVLTAASLENELSESESEGGDSEQCDEFCSGMIIGGTTLRSLSANETAAGSEGKSGGVKSNLCMTLETTEEDQLPVSQTSLPENNVSVQKEKDKTVEHCGILKEINFPVECMKEFVAKYSETPLKVDFDNAVQNNYSAQCSLLNSTFVLPEPSPSPVPEKTPTKMAQESSAQPRTQVSGNK